MAPHVLRATRILLATLAAVMLLLALAAGGAWWWAGQEGSLAWVLQRLGRWQPVQVEGVQGSVRAGWRIGKLVWEREGLRVVAEGVRLEWTPAALLQREVLLREVQADTVTVTDTRAPSNEPMKPPPSLALPWRVTVGDLQVGRLAYTGKTSVEASQLAARYGYDGVQHALELRSLRYAGGSYEGKASLRALPPMQLDAQLRGALQAPVPGVPQPLPLQFDARLDGPLQELGATALLRVPPDAQHTGELPQATATARITPWAAFPLAQARADLRNLDVSMLWPQAPRTQLAGRVEVQPAGTASWTLSADLRNAQAGPWDKGQLPVHALQARGAWSNGTALVEQLLASAGGGELKASGRWRGGGAWTVSGEVRGVDPQALHTQLAPLPLTGPLQAQGDAEGIDFDVDLDAAAPRDRRNAAAHALALQSVATKGRWSQGVLTLSALDMRASEARLQGSARVHVRERAGDGKLQLQAPGLRADANGSISEARGAGTATVQGSDLGQALAWLRRWPGLTQLAAPWQLRGRADAQLAWQGGWRDPAVQASLRAASVDAINASQRNAPPLQLRDAQATLRGRLARAQLDARAQLQQGQRRADLRLAGDAGRSGEGARAVWRGTVNSLTVDAQDGALGPGLWRLASTQAFAWRFGGGATELGAGRAVLNAPAHGKAPSSQALLAWGPLRAQGGTLETSGTLSGLPLGWIELFGGSQLAGAGLTGDMVFDARWTARLGDAMRVNAEIVRTRGDVTVLAEGLDGGSTRVAAGVRDARLTLAGSGDQLVLAMHWDSERAGTAEGRIATRLARAGGGWQWPENAPLQGRVRAQLPRIGVWSLLAPPGWRLRGSLTADVAVAGTRTQPLLQGPLQADDLALRSVVDGIELRDGRLRAELAGQRIVVREFFLRGADTERGNGGNGGTLVAHGEGAWTANGPELNVNAQLTRLRASIRSDRELTLSGPMQATVGTRGTTVSGKLQFDRARITIPEQTAPRLDSDIVVRNAPGLPETDRERRERPAASTSPGRTVTVAIDVDLGSDFRVQGRGIDTRLAGSVSVAGQSLAQPRVTGLIRTVGGEYQAYGQRMRIERGEIRFTGVPDNPALDVLAIRPNMTERVGVLVTGRAQAPHIELYSEPARPQAETLSLLVLGRGSTGGGAETALLQRAAAALIAGRGGHGKGIAGRLGLDDVSVRNDNTAGAVVRLGRRFGNNLYAAYERSLSGALGTLYIFYDLTQRLTVRAETGDRTGVDLIFTFTFDGPGRKRAGAAGAMGASGGSR